MKREAQQPYIVIQQMNFKKRKGFIFDYDTIMQQLEKELPEKNFDFASSKYCSTEDLGSHEFQKAMEIVEKKDKMSSREGKNEKKRGQSSPTHSDRSPRNKIKRKNSKKMSKKLSGKIHTTTGKASKDGEEDGKEKQSKNNKKMVYFLKKKEEIGLP